MMPLMQQTGGERLLLGYWLCDFFFSITHPLLLHLVCGLLVRQKKTVKETHSCITHLKSDLEALPQNDT